MILVGVAIIRLIEIHQIVQIGYQFGLEFTRCHTLALVSVLHWLVGSNEQ